MTDYSKITALYSRLSVGDEDRDGGESNSIQNQKIFLENYARGQHLTNIRHYIDDDESGRFFDRSAYSRMMDDVENGKIGVCIMKDLTRWGRDYLQVGNAMEIFRRNNVRFIAVNNGIDSEKPDTLEFAPFINIMSEWYAKDISKKVKTGIKTKGMSGKPIVTEAPYGYVKDPDNKDFWIIDEEAAAVVRLIFRLFIGGKNRNQIAVHLKNEQIPTPTFYMKDRGRGTCKNKTLNEDSRCKWNKATLTNILTRQEYCGDVVNFKTTKHFRDKHNHYVDRSQWHITENVHEPIISRSDFETVQRILENASVKRPNGDGEIHPLSGLLFCKDCGAKMHIRIDYRNGGKRHVAYCSEYHKGKAKNPKCSSPHIMDADLLMQTIAEVLKKIEDYSPPSVSSVQTPRSAGDDLLDVHLLPLPEPCAAAAAVGAGLTVFHGGVAGSAVVAPCNGRDDLVPELRVFYQRRLFCVPLPAVAQILRHYAGHLAELQRDGLYVGKSVLLGYLADLLDDIGHYAKLVHNFPF